jgi:hypothetical protein
VGDVGFYLVGREACEPIVRVASREGLPPSLLQLVEVTRIYRHFVEANQDASIGSPRHTIYGYPLPRSFGPIAGDRDTGEQLVLQRQVVGFTLRGRLQADGQ